MKTFAIRPAVIVAEHLIPGVPARPFAVPGNTAVGDAAALRRT
jgi:hypothetical protein